MDSLRPCVPNIETDRDGGLVSPDALWNRNGIGASLFHRFRQLQEQPVVELASQGMIGIHRLRLTPHMLGTNDTKALIVAGTDAPKGSLLGTVGFQPFSKDEQGIVAFRKRMAQIGTGACAVVAIMHFTITEM